MGEHVALKTLLLTLFFGVAYVLGLGFRVSGPAYALLLFWLLSYRNSWSMIYHTQNLIVVNVLVLGVARSADVFSLDAAVRGLAARFRRTSGRPAAGWLSLSGEAYGWPIRLMAATTLCAYFLAGVAKVSGAYGWGWAGGTALLTPSVRISLPMVHLGLPKRSIRTPGCFC